jgi:hypothetical protein
MSLSSRHLGKRPLSSWGRGTFLSDADSDSPATRETEHVAEGYVLKGFVARKWAYKNLPPIPTVFLDIIDLDMGSIWSPNPTSDDIIDVRCQKAVKHVSMKTTS